MDPQNGGDDTLAVIGVIEAKRHLKAHKNNRKFWNQYAKLYDWEIRRFNGSAYAEIYRLMKDALTKEMKVLEIATGTGLIALGIAPSVHCVEAIDFSPRMIETAKKKKVPNNNNVHFSVGDATYCLMRINLLMP